MIALDRIFANAFIVHHVKPHHLLRASGAADEASAEYFNLYKRVSGDHPDVLPPDATVKDYAAKLRDTYPFHPRLVDTARNRLGNLPGFQKSRGTLRLFARLLRDVYESESDVALLNAGDVDWSSASSQAPGGCLGV